MCIGKRAFPVGTSGKESDNAVVIRDASSVPGLGRSSQLWGWKVGRGIQGGFTMKMIYDQNLEGTGSVTSQYMYLLPPLCSLLYSPSPRRGVNSSSTGNVSPSSMHSLKHPAKQLHPASQISLSHPARPWPSHETCPRSQRAMPREADN